MLVMFYPSKFYLFGGRQKALEILVKNIKKQAFILFSRIALDDNKIGIYTCYNLQSRTLYLSMTLFYQLTMVWHQAWYTLYWFGTAYIPSLIFFPVVGISYYCVDLAKVSKTTGIHSLQHIQIQINSIHSTSCRDSGSNQERILMKGMTLSPVLLKMDFTKYWCEFYIQQRNFDIKR